MGGTRDRPREEVQAAPVQSQVAAGVAGPSVPPQQAAPVDLASASALLEGISLDILQAIVAAKQQAAHRPESAMLHPAPKALDARQSARELLATTRQEVMSNDAPKMSNNQEQQEQFLDGTQMLLDTAKTALDTREARSLVSEQVDLALECVQLALRRHRCYQAALKGAGPSAQGNFLAVYDLWHGKRRSFAKDDFDPDSFEKKDFDTAVSRSKRAPRSGDEARRTDDAQDRYRSAPRRDVYRGMKQQDRGRNSYHKDYRGRSRSRSPAKRR